MCEESMNAFVTECLSWAQTNYIIIDTSSMNVNHQDISVVCYMSLQLSLFTKIFL